MKKLFTTSLPPHRFVFFLAWLLMLALSSCKDLDLFSSKKDKSKKTSCQLQSFFFGQPNSPVDSNVFTYRSDGLIESFRRMSRAVNGTITPIREGNLFYNDKGLLERVEYPLTEGVLTLQYSPNKHLTKLEYKEKDVLVQEYDVTTTPQGDITSLTGRGRNTTKMVYTINDQGYVSEWERFDQAGNRLILTVNEDFDPAVTHHVKDVYPGIPVWVQNNIATLSFDPQISNNGPWRTSTSFIATDAQGNYNGIIREVKSTVSFITTKEGYIYERSFSNTAGAGGTANYRYFNCGQD